MKATPDIANRHLLQADGLAEKPLHVAQRVRIVVGDDWAASRAGQLLVSCLVNLLVRQVELVTTIEIVSPTAASSVVNLPNGDAAGPFPECLGLIASWAVKRRVEVVISGEGTIEPDVTVMVGTKVAIGSGAALFAVGNGWKAWVGLPDHVTPDVAPDSPNPMGPFFAAALVAGEIFKRCRGLLRGRFLDGDGYSLWSGVSSPDWEALEDGPELAGTRLRPIHVVGAGAVANGLAYLLANAQFDEAFAVLLDDDTYDDTSLNRCFLAGWEDVDDPKVDAIVGALVKSGVGAYAFPGTISQYVTANRSGLRPDIARQADDLAFDIVASCVDRGISRQHIQGLSPNLLCGGSTLGLAARANLYPNEPGAACLSCFNPAEQDGDKLRALEKKLREMDEEQRATFLRKEGIEPQLIEEFLKSPRCGSMGEAALRDLATRSASEFSVGFVSLGAALLLAASLFQQVLFRTPLRRGNMVSLNFKNGGLLDSFLAPDDNCEWGCQKKRFPT